MASSLFTLPALRRPADQETEARKESGTLSTTSLTEDKWPRVRLRFTVCSSVNSARSSWGVQRRRDTHARPRHTRHCSYTWDPQHSSWTTGPAFPAGEDRGQGKEKDAKMQAPTAEVLPQHAQGWCPQGVRQKGAGHRKGFRDARFLPAEMGCTCLLGSRS